MVLILIVGALHIMGKYTQQSDEDILQQFENTDAIATVNRVKIGSQSLRYITVEDSVSIGSNTLPLMLFLHGAPGTWSDFEAYLKDSTLLKNYKMISIDRLGYGGSSYGTPETSIKVQSLFIDKVIEDQKNESSHIVLVGHSYGGPIAAYTATVNKKISALIMLAPVNDPASEEVFWFSKVLAWTPIYYLMPGFIKSATAEKIDHPSQLSLMMDRWGLINVPTYHLHSSIDWIAPGNENMKFSTEHIDSTYLTMYDREDKDHFIPWNDFEFVKEILLSLKFD